jgi:TIR domain
MKEHQPLNVFCVCTQEDLSLWEELRCHLSVLQRQGLVASWYVWKFDRETELEEVGEALAKAQVILLFINSRSVHAYQRSDEVREAVRMGEKGKALVFPILSSAIAPLPPFFQRLTFFPNKAKALTSWKDREEALCAHTRYILSLARSYQALPKGGMPRLGALHALERKARQRALSEWSEYQTWYNDNVDNELIAASGITSQGYFYSFPSARKHSLATSARMSQPIEIFCCAAEADQFFLEKLKTRLTLQEQQGTIKFWDKSQIFGGANAGEVIRRHLDNAQVFLLLISSDFLSDDYCYKTVMKAALRRHMNKEAITIPVIIRPTDWRNVRILQDIQPLPRNGKPISSLPDEDHALWSVAKEIGSVIEGLDGSQIGSPIKEPRQPTIGSDTESEYRPYGGIYSPIENGTQTPVRNPLPQNQSQDIPSDRGEPVLESSGRKNGPTIHEHSQPESLTKSDHVPVNHYPILRRRWVWTLVGMLILLSGVLWGVTSPTVPYIKTPAHFYLYPPTTNGDIYISSTDKSTFFIARHEDFSPPIDPTKIHLGMPLNFVARPNTIRVNDTIDGQSVAEAHVIEQLELYDNQDSPTPLATYRASDYNPSSGDYYESRWWPVAVALIIAGLVIACATLFVGSKRRTSDPRV